MSDTATHYFKMLVDGQFLGVVSGRDKQSAARRFAYRNQAKSFGDFVRRLSRIKNNDELDVKIEPVGEHGAFKGLEPGVYVFVSGSFAALYSSAQGPSPEFVDIAGHAVDVAGMFTLYGPFDSHPHALSLLANVQRRNDA